MRRYWIYQCLGWLAYSAIGLTINLLNGAALVPLIVGHLVLISCSIGLTHLFRLQIRRGSSAGQPLSRLWPRLAVGVILISLVQTTAVIATNLAFGGSSWDRTSVVALWWGMLLATGVWTLLYVRFSERRSHAAREGQLTLALREAELRALEAQINPHFLFNCLNSIRALVEIDPARAQEMLTRLANVLRNSLRQNRPHAVALSEEVEAAGDYLALETIRFADRLQTRIAVDPAAANCRIPPMVLQTLVENAIKHGIGKVAGPGELRIAARLESDLLRLVVENTGRLTVSPITSPQFGLQNIRERIKLLYGDRASLSLIDSGGLVTATVLLPRVQ